MSDVTTVSCRCCGGRGRVPLAPYLRRTWDVLRDEGPLTAVKVRASLLRRGEEASLPSVTQRLKDLSDLGLVQRTRIDRTPDDHSIWCWEVTGGK